MADDTRWADSMPEAYDRLLGPVIFKPFARFLAAAAAHVQPSSVLELAAGTGVATSALVDAIPAARIVATDLNETMVSWGSAREAGATWQQADAQELPFPAASFDLVACAFGVMFFPDKTAAFAEAARVMAPGGTLIFTVWDTMDTSAFTRALAASLLAVFPVDTPTFFTRVPHGYTDGSAIRRDLMAGGFARVEIERVVLPGTAPSAAEIAEGFCLGTPLRFALMERGPLLELTQAMADAMTARLGEGAVTEDLAAFVVTAR